MKSREAFLKTIQHQEPGRIVVDFGGQHTGGKCRSNGRNGEKVLIPIFVAGSKR
jgi:hypothetical protein